MVGYMGFHIGIYVDGQPPINAIGYESISELLTVSTLSNIKIHALLPQKVAAKLVKIIIKTTLISNKTHSLPLSSYCTSFEY